MYGVPSYETFSVRPKDRQPLLDWMIEALESSDCRLLFVSEPNRAPFRLTFETRMGERIGIVAYAFLANKRETKGRPSDEHRFQIKYGSRDGSLHELWQDPTDLYTTLFLGINPDLDLFVAADPVLHSPTLFFISLEFKEKDVRRILDERWVSWERVKRSKGWPEEVLVGGTKEHFLRLIRFERAAKGLDPGHRQLLADKLAEEPRLLRPQLARDVQRAVNQAIHHEVTAEFQLSEEEILDLINSAPRLKMAVRGWVAEAHLHKQLLDVPGVEDCVQIEEEGGADIRLRYRGSPPLEIECKNVLRQRLADGTIRLDFQRTRASKEDPCTRFYSTTDFDLVAACLHSCTESWEFRYRLTKDLDPHKKCPGKLSNLVRLDHHWLSDVSQALAAAAKVV